MNNNIFCFWEPSSRLPKYLELCMETWKKFLPDYQIFFLNYHNYQDFFDINIYPKKLFTKEFTLPLQADAIRCAVLKQNGGIWFDCDTLITTEKISNLINNEVECNFIGDNNGIHIGIIWAKKNARLLQFWEESIITRLNNKKLLANRDWSFLGNSILNPYIKTCNSNEYNIIDKTRNFILLEHNYMLENKYKKGVEENYRYFYFENNFFDFFKKKNPNIIYLHNSWTYAEIKRMPKDIFIQCDNTLSNIICYLLNISSKKNLIFDINTKSAIEKEDKLKKSIFTISIDDLVYKMYLPEYKIDIEQKLIANSLKPKEQDVLKAIRKIIKKPKETFFIDIGHNCGNHSVYFAQLGCTVLSFEANKHLNIVLQKTIEINNFNNITLFDFALGDKPFKTRFKKLVPSHTGSQQLDCAINNEEFDIEVKTFDSLSLSIPYKNSIVKIDVEGMELQVLQGMREMIDKSRPLALFIEIHDLLDFKEINSFLHEFGYTCYHMHSSHTMQFMPTLLIDDISSFISWNTYYQQELLTWIRDNRSFYNKKNDELKNSIFWSTYLQSLYKLLPECLIISQDTTKYYLQLYIKNFPKTIHYELNKKDSEILCCLHCEDLKLTEINKNALKNIATKLEANFFIYKEMGMINKPSSANKLIDNFYHFINQSLNEVKQLEIY